MTRAGAGRAARSCRTHRGLLTVLALGGIVRLAVDVQRQPAVYQDSLVYLGIRDSPSSLSPFRPNGYPWALRAVAVVSDSLDLVTAVQHLAGLALGVLVYALLLRLGSRRWVAVLAAAAVLLDAHLVALEQAVLTETLFGLLLLGSVSLVLGRGRPGWARTGASGLLLAAAALTRAVALFAFPVWLILVLKARPGRRAAVAAVLGLLVPVLAYCSFHAARGRGFNLTEADGWYLYAKVAPIVRPPCPGTSRLARPLCTDPLSDDPDFYLYEPSSPAHRLFFGEGRADVEEQVDRHNNAVLRRFALATIRTRPRAFLDVVSGDLFRFFHPGAPPPELKLYGAPDSNVVRYERAFRTRWWLLGGLLLAGVLACPLPWVAPRRRRALALLSCTSVALLAGAAATGPFNPRYLLPLAPLVVCGGALAVEDVAARLGLGVEVPGHQGGEGGRRRRRQGPRHRR